MSTLHNRTREIHTANVYRCRVPAVAPSPTLHDLIDTAMHRLRTDAVKIEHATGVPADWTRQLKAGRMKGNAHPDRVHKVAAALQLDEAEVWALLGRYDIVAALRMQPETKKEPGTDAGLVAEVRDLLAAQTAMFTELLVDARAERKALEEQAEALETAVRAMAARLAALEAKAREARPAPRGKAAGH